MAAWHRFVNQWRGRQLEREFDDELQFHFDTRVEAGLRRGLTRGEAEAEARRHLGSTLRAREGMREARVSGLLDGLVRDCRHAARLLRRRPGSAALAILTLSLGIGANAAIFSLLEATLLRPLPFPDAARLVAVVDRFGERGNDPAAPTIPEILDARAWSRNLEGLSFFDTRDAQINGGDEPARAVTARIEPSLWPILGARPALGRLLDEADSRGGSEPVVVLSDGLWRRNFGADRAVVGRPILINGQRFTVAGVLPADFGFETLVAEAPDIFLPYPMVPVYTSRAAEFSSVRRVTAVGRLMPGVTVEQASAELAAIGATLARQHPALYPATGSDAGFSMGAEPLRDLARGGTARVRPVLTLLAAAVALVLLIACVNTAQFLLAQAAERQPEFAVRSALGAGRHRLIRQFLAESLLLAAIAGMAGVLQAVWLMALLQQVLPEGAPVVGELGVSGRVLLFTASAAMATAFLCGLVPALRCAQARPAGALETRGVPGQRARARQIMIAVEVAVSVVLLVGAALLVQSIRELQRASGGYSADTVTVMRMRGVAADRLGPRYQQYLERIAAIPDVGAAAIASAPLPGFPESTVSLDGRYAGPSSPTGASYQIVSPGYFATLGIPLLEGRAFTVADSAGRPAVAIVNEEMVRRSGAALVGQQIRSGTGPRAATLTVVGVVGNVRPIFQAEDFPQVYVPLLQQEEPSVVLLVRPRPGADTPVDAVKRAVWSVSPAQALFGIEPFSSLASGRMAEHRSVALLLGAFALLAVVMSITGVYTVVAYLVSRRTREIALRRAIGATGADVLSLLAGQTFRWTLGGVAAGIAGAVAGSGSLRAAVAGVIPLEPATLLVIASLYMVVVAVAVGVPALRALRLDPATALRAE